MRLVLLLFLSSLFLFAELTTVKIGVLAKRGESITHTRWDATAEYLSKQIEGHHFEIIALGFDAMKQSVAKGDIDFVLTNSVYYVDLEYHYGISRIATLINRDHGSMELTRFGGVLFTQADNETIHELADIKGKRFAAVDPLSFGGWIMAQYELQKIDIYDEDLQLTFYGSHDKVVQAVIDGEADIGTVRSDTLERMLEEDQISMDRFRIIDQRPQRDFPYISSTTLYPEWPFSKLPHTSRLLANDVLTTLLTMPKESRAANDAHIAGWTIPLDYNSVHQVLKELKLSPYDQPDKITLTEFYHTYKTQLWALGVLFITTIVIIIYVLRLNSTISSLNINLERRVKERTRKVEELLEEEKEHSELVDAILNSQKNIVLLSDGIILLRANQAILDISGFDSLGALTTAHRCICELFLKEDGYIYDFKDKNWLEYIMEHPELEHKAKMNDQRSGQVRVYLIKSASFAIEHHDLFIITLTDISELESAYRLISDRAVKDELTGIYNRRKLHEVIDLEFNRAHHNGSTFSIVMFDIDDFKLINDTYGHAAGDYVLKSISKIVSAHIRHSDTLARWGGEEFMILTPIMDLKNAYEKAEKLRILIALYPFEKVGQITCSFGVAEYHEGLEKHALLKTVDSRLYKAKESGKNKVVAE